MYERRRSERVPVQIHLSISDLFQQDTTGIQNLDAPIEVYDISSHGLGFTSECILPQGYYFNAAVNFDDAAPSIFTVVHIVRFEIIGRNHYSYGCEFTELPQDLACIIDRYATDLSISTENCRIV